MSSKHKSDIGKRIMELFIFGRYKNLFLNISVTKIQRSNSRETTMNSNSTICL